MDFTYFFHTLYIRQNFAEQILKLAAYFSCYEFLTMTMLFISTILQLNNQ